MKNSSKLITELPGRKNWHLAEALLGSDQRFYIFSLLEYAIDRSQLLQNESN